MKKNVGSSDSVIRIIVAAVIIILYLTKVISGTWAIILGIIAVVALITGLIGYCPGYLLFGINTCKKKEGQ